MKAVGPIGSMLGGLVTKIMPLAGPIAAIAGAGAAGVMAGNAINNFVEEKTG